MVDSTGDRIYMVYSAGGYSSHLATRLSHAGFKETNGHVGEAHTTGNSELPPDPQPARKKTICPAAHKELDAAINM